LLGGDLRKHTVGVLVGTPDYMAPEQVEAKGEIDARTDIYAFGAMSFELASGVAPWDGPSVIGALAARLVQDPPDVRKRARVSDAFAAVVARCMARAPADRYASADEIARDLEAIVFPAEGPPRSTLAPPPAAPGTRVAVEIAYASGGDIASAAAEGFVDLVERNLRGANALQVVAPGSGASFVLRAGVEVAGDEVVLALELMNVDDGVLLAQTQERAHRAGLFAVAARVASMMATKLAAGYHPTLPDGPSDGEVVDLWLRARSARATGLEGARDRAVALFEQAIERAPDDVWVNAGYAAVLVDRFRFDETKATDIVEACGMAEHALAATDRLGEAWLARALCRIELGEPLAAVDDFARAAQAMPDEPAVRSARGRVWLEIGWFDRAIDDFDRAIASEPQRASHRVARALALALDGDDAGAAAAIDEALALEPRSLTAWVAAARLALWSGESARRSELRRASERVAFMGLDRVQQLLDVVEEEDRSGFGNDAPHRASVTWQIEAELASTLGDLAGAMESVERAASTRGFIDLAWLSRCPLLAPLRDAPRFTALLERTTEAARIVQLRLEPQA